ncbi:MAG: iron-containing alcohol dehydrogenase [Alphaproteobacteria bacterium]|nr:iron-containing alcohol dehydrogenase [Alphaproteobacteria bacterium]
MEPFTFIPPPGRILFGPGTAWQVKEEIQRIGATRALFCCTGGRRDDTARLAQSVGPLNVGICDQAQLNTPSHVAEAGVALARKTNADVAVAYGGGSTVGLAKIIAHECDIPYIAIVTTFSGSEMNAGQGINRGGRKVNVMGPRMRPASVIYDQETIAGLPLSVAVPSGMNAISHACECLYGAGANPPGRLLAEEGIRIMAQSLRRMVEAPDDLAARGEAQYGAYLCAAPMATTRVALQHKICHTIGNGWGTPHAENHSIVLPHSLAYNRNHAPESMRQIARALGDADGDAPTMMYELLGLLNRIGGPVGLKDNHMPYDGLDQAADIVAAEPYPNPRPFEREAIRALLEDAWHGHPPAGGRATLVHSR